MTQEEKARAYDKALERAKGIHHFSSDIAEIKRMEQIFPELKESEDEKMKNWILDELRLSYQWAAGDRDRCEELLKAIVWLEKQGKSKWSEEDDKMLHTIIADFKGFKSTNTSTLESHFNECINWLKSIKQRMEEQQ